MIYDKLPVALLSALSAEGPDSTNAQVARYLLTHAGTMDDLSVKSLAAACHVGVGTISRFAKEVGFESFAELREAFAETARDYQQVEGNTCDSRSNALLGHMTDSLERVHATLDAAALARLVDDLCAYEKVSAFGLLKAQAAALGLQVDLLMQGRFVETCTSLTEQLSHIGAAHSDELVILFSYTGGYFDTKETMPDLRRIDRPKIWMVCGQRRELPSFMSDVLLFSSDLDQFGHPFQLQYVASLIAQEVAAR